MTRGDYTIGDLLSEPHLGLELLTGGDPALRIPLLGVHSIELENPAQWLDAGWMMLTMGVRLRAKPRLQQELIRDLQELGASCLGFGVGLAFKTLPDALLDEANARNFPVVFVPERTQFRDITRAVFHSTVDIESTTFQRLSSIQQNLLRAFAEPDPLVSITQRLGRVVHSTVAVIALDGTVAASTGALPTSQIAAALRERADLPMAEIDVDRWKILAAPVSATRGPAARWLVVASTGATVTHELARAALQVSAPLIDALLRLSIAGRSQDRAIRQAVLDGALEDPAPPQSQPAESARTLRARAKALGIEFNGRFRTVVLRDEASRRPVHVDAGEWSTWLHARLERSGAQYLLTVRESETILVADEDHVLPALFEDITSSFPLALIGVGRVLAEIEDIRESYRDAQIAVQHLTVRKSRGVMYFEGLDVVTRLLAEISPDRLASAVGPLAAQLGENPMQLEALRAFFAMNRDVKAAAESIHLHPNTLRYRLERLEQTLGKSLRDPAVTASLYCALTLLPAQEQLVLRRDVSPDELARAAG